MVCRSHPSTARAGARTAASAMLLALLATGAQAQYKVVAPDGSVTYTDRPPQQAVAAGSKVMAMGRSGAVAAAPAAPPLPLELRSVAARFPVTLYSSPDCGPCDSGRRLLQQRGVPYTERNVQSEDDAEALQRLSGSRSVPTLTVGQQVQRGLLESEWQTLLDLAGYPRESRLPRGWQAPASAPASAQASAPTVARAPVPAAPTRPPAPTAVPASAPSDAEPTGDAGGPKIRF